MSLNGDVVVMRNGRSTSQVSIYNYPEHLNPFYEDDQHKRLRFWHIKKNDNNGRRNSFSMGGLKDIWTFKSFRLKKKSSTLGINKTSESPPPFRREIEKGSTTNNGFYTYDPRKRHTDSVDDKNFQRNATYRSSLQNMNTSQNTYDGVGFNRNDQYRSTIQVGTGASPKSVPTPRRYVYGGSVTPQPLRNPDRRNYNGQLTQGSSQTSINTNPFDTDVDETTSIDETMSQSRISASHRNQRKKRRAPAPPDPQIHKPNGQTPVLESSQQSSSQCRELRIEEDLDISNLTAEIENFVKASNDNTEIELEKTQSTLPDKSPTTVTITVQPATPTTVCQDKIITSETIVVKPAVPTRTTKTKTFNNPEITPSSINKIEAVEKSTVMKPAATTLNKNNNIENGTCIQSSSTDKQQQTQQIECIHVHVNNPQATYENNKPTNISSFQPNQKDLNKKIINKTSFTLVNSPVSENHAQTDVMSTKADVLTKKAEHTENELVISEDTAPVKPSTPNKPPIAAKPILESRNAIKITPEVHRPIKSTLIGDTTNSEPIHDIPDIAPIPTSRELKTEKLITTTKFAPGPLKIDESNDAQTVEVEFKSLYRTQPRTPLEWKHSTLAPLETHVPPERRRSVKDIIESINRSQRLLHNSAHKHDTSSSTSELNNLDKSINSAAALNCNGKNDEGIKSEEVLSSASQFETAHTSSFKDDDDISESITTENNPNKDPLKLNNEDIFLKCKVDKESHDVRESSPTTSNLDWNPVPKPKRTKNL